MRSACELFQHPMATQMMVHGADIRCTQAMLGHSSRDTMRICPHVSIAKL
jgi:site-specific recombinase XerD